VFATRGRPPRYGGRYEGVIAVVTGASSGLGRRLALDLADAGAEVIGLARRPELLAELETDLRGRSPKSTTAVCNVADTLNVLPGMYRRGSGTIVNVSSDGGRSPGPGAYRSSAK
jgi:NADP-dependent 3-hydroxy acid dehydrogenase YdfG